MNSLYVENHSPEDLIITVYQEINNHARIADGLMKIMRLTDGSNLSMQQKQLIADLEQRVTSIYALKDIIFGWIEIQRARRGASDSAHAAFD